METGNLCIRKAQSPDVDDIFWLLHSESFAWNTGQIAANLNDLYVMLCKDKLIGVACFKSTDVRAEFCWAAIHPMYPEKAMSVLFSQTFQQGLFFLG